MCYYQFIDRIYSSKLPLDAIVLRVTVDQYKVIEMKEGRMS